MRLLFVGMAGMTEPRGMLKESVCVVLSCASRIPSTHLYSSAVVSGNRWPGTVGTVAALCQRFCCKCDFVARF